MSPAIAGTPLFSVSDIEDVTYNTQNRLFVTVRSAGGLVSYDVDSTGAYRTMQQSGLPYDRLYVSSGSTALLRDNANTLSFNGSGYVSLSPAIAGTPLFSVSEIEDVTYNTPNRLFVTVRSAAAVPEPSSFALFAAALGLAALRRRK